MARFLTLSNGAAPGWGCPRHQVRGPGGRCPMCALERRGRDLALAFVAGAAAAALTLAALFIALP